MATKNGSQTPGRIKSNNKITFHRDTCKLQHFVYNGVFSRLRMTVNETETVLMTD